MLTKALILFVDIRGFTHWSSDADVHAHVVEFINGFEKLCDGFYTTHGVQTELHLGWGITRGDVWTRDHDHIHDFIGKNINEAARLCGMACPFGIAIDADDFRDLPVEVSAGFQRQSLEIDGFHTMINAWVTDEIAERINPADGNRGNPSVFVSGVCLRREQGILEVLDMKRHRHREFFPGLLEVSTGGQLTKDESFSDGVQRHFLHELAIEVDVDTRHFTTYQFSNREGELIPGVRHVCWHVAGQPQLVNYDEFHWMSRGKFQAQPDGDFLPGLKVDILPILDQVEN